MTGGERLRRILNWINLSTVCGLGIARARRCEVQSGSNGLIFAFKYTGRLPVASAFTVGNVVLFRASQEKIRPQLIAHEARHSTQYAVCLGLPFLPLYFLAAGWSFLRTGDPASRNIFERWAGLHDGGYT